VLEVLLVLDADWFAGPIGYVGVLAVPLVGGVFPLLLVAAARRKGEYVPGQVVRLLGHPVTVAALSILFLAGVFLHGIVIWQEPVARGAAIAVGLATIALIARVVRSGRFRPRSIIEIRLADAGRASLSVTTDGRSIVADKPLRASGGHAGLPAPVTVPLPPSDAREVRIWSHRVTADGWSTAVPSSASVVDRDGAGAGDSRTVAAGTIDPILIPIDAAGADVTVTLHPPERSR
jgi:hypothetical protein